MAWIWGSKIRFDFWSKNFKAENWFILGVTIHFAGTLLDNAYWGIAWQESYLETEGAENWFKFGVVPNVANRQAATFLAAMCHLQAAATRARELGRNPHYVSIIWWLSVGLGIIYVSLLMILRSP